MEYKKTVETTGDLVGNKITRVSENLQQKNSETVTNEEDKEIPKEILKEIYISPEERQKIIDNLR